MGDTERQLRWALICGIDVALKCGTDGHWQMAWMSTESWHRWTLTGGAAGTTQIVRAH
ncbi:unnamed protein product [Staurois parvus]|uniref:Uncharacterized protein n=1 Tax=Staurois parvus TaxID=386267 RepID=A0ABN9HCJ4_9NEOB|nr:unnamed protein product [Staurois parvus]